MGRELYFHATTRGITNRVLVKARALVRGSKGISKQAGVLDLGKRRAYGRVEQRFVVHNPTHARADGEEPVGLRGLGDGEGRGRAARISSRASLASAQIHRLEICFQAKVKVVPLMAKAR